MINDKDLHNDLYDDEQDLNESGFDSNCDDEEDDYFSNLIDEIDFSEIRGKNFKHSLSKINKVVNKKKAVKKPLKRSVSVKKTATLHGTNKTNNILVPRDRAVIVNGLNEFILSNNKTVSDSKDIGLYKGRKLKELVLTIFNDTTNDFDIDLFNPSASLEYMFSSGQNLNDRIQVAGGNIKYSDVLFNILANPLHIIRTKLTVAGASVNGQINRSIRFNNKSATGEQIVNPFQVQLQIDNMQVANDIVFFDFSELDVPFIVDGMNTAQYTVLAGNTVTFAFFYDQTSIAKQNFRNVKNLNHLL